MFAVFALESTCNLVDKRVFWSVFAYIKTEVVTFGGRYIRVSVITRYFQGVVTIRESLLSEFYRTRFPWPLRKT